MEKHKFTQGEWYVSNGVFVCVKGEGEDAIVSVVGLLSDAKANAHLIAAAPEMYELLQSIALTEMMRGDYAFSEQINELLAKARGES